MKFTTEQMRNGGALTETLSARSQKLKDGVLNAPKTSSWEMASLTKKAYEMYASKPWPVQRAEVLKYFFENETIYIREGELLVGNRSEKPGAMPRIPDGLCPVSREFCLKAPFPAGDGEERWEHRLLFEEYNDLLSDKAKEVEYELLAGLAPGGHEGFGHIIGDYEYVIKHGAADILERANKRLLELPQEAEKQRNFLQAVIIAWTGVVNWAARYADLAEKLAKELEDQENAGEMKKRELAERPAEEAKNQELKDQETAEELQDQETVKHASAERKEELLEIARICRKVPMYPAETFAEALQSFWFVHQAFTIEQKAGSISVSGLDRYLNDYLIRDIEQGRLSWEKADLLTEGLIIKFMENSIWPVHVVMFANLSLGGMDKDGNDAANELSFLLVNGQMKVRSNTPLISVRWHPNINREFWLLAHRSIRMGSGLPALFSDVQMIGALKSWGVPEEMAVDYGVVGCVEPAVKGETMGATLGGHLNLAKCLELTVNNGRTLLTQVQLGPDTGDLTSYASMEALLKAYTIQVENAVRYDVEMVNAAAKAQRDRFGYPVMSPTMNGSIERAQDMTDGIDYNYPTVCILGITDVVDSMLALKHFVFDTKEISAKELLTAMRLNYQNDEVLRQKLLNYPVKFGNGSEEAVALYNHICSIHNKAVTKYSGPRGGSFQCGVWPVELHVRFGKKTGALPSGRKAGTPLIDGVGACHGMDRNGPTALLRDMAGVDAVSYWPGGYTFNVRFAKSMMETEEDLERFAALTDTYFRLGGMQMQINTISAETLRKAQQHPEEYGDLVVRVAGFSTYFVGLSKEVQDEIIDRTTHS